MIPKKNSARELGVVYFGSVHCAKYVKGSEDEKVVRTKLRGESNEAKRRFSKETEMLHVLFNLVL